MEGILLLLIFFFYILIRLAFGFKKDPVEKDRKRYAHGMHLLNARRYDEAYTYFNRVLDAQPNSALALYARAKCHLEMGEPLLAVADASKSAGIEPYLSGVYLVKGRGFFKMGLYNDALLELDKAVWFDRTNGQVYLWRGLTWNRLGEEGKGYNDFLEARRLGEENAAFYLRKKGSIEIWS
jgi:tetratricopeptide (TPR) repeat protein